MPNIFNIQADLYAIIDQLIDNEGELTPELEEALTIKKEEFASKLDAYAYVIDQNKGLIETLKVEAERLSKKIQVIENLNDRIKTNVLLPAILAFGEDNKSGQKAYKTTTRSFWNQPSESVEIDEETFLVDNVGKPYISYSVKPRFDYDMIKAISKVYVEKTNNQLEITPVVDKAMIKSKINAGETVNGATIVTKPSLRIR
jgi:hypothetical protein